LRPDVSPRFPHRRRFPVSATAEQTDVKPIIVLVHGAFADASSWNGVIGRLQQQGYTVIAFAADLPVEITALMAATQRHTAVTAFSEASGPPAWKKLPSWTVVATGDKAAGADVIKCGRAGCAS
jgi:hypothetical protein